MNVLNREVFDKQTTSIFPSWGVAPSIPCSFDQTRVANKATCRRASASFCDVQPGFRHFAPLKQSAVAKSDLSRYVVASLSSVSGKTHMGRYGRVMVGVFTIRGGEPRRKPTMTTARARDVTRSCRIALPLHVPVRPGFSRTSSA